MPQLMTLLRIGLFVCVIGKIQCQQAHLPAEKGQPVTLECSFGSPTTSITWKLLDAGNKEVNVTTCTTITCTDRLPRSFTGHVARSAGVYKSTLDIASVAVDKTRFKCVTGAGVVVANITIDVYVVASTPKCSTTLAINRYLDVTCVTENVYPSFQGTLHRRQPGNLVIDRNSTSCTVGPPGSGSKGDCKGECTFRVLFGSLLETNTLYFEIVPVVWNNTIVDKPAFSRDYQVAFNLPNVEIKRKDCPGMDGREIRKGTTVTCRCDLKQSGFIVSGIVRWFKKDGTVVGDEDPRGRFSVLNVAYNASDPDAEYDCRAVNPSATYYHVLYKPKFTSAASGNIISALVVVMTLTAAYLGVTFQTL